MYDDTDYHCVRTHVVLSVYSDRLDHDAISRELGLEPTEKRIAHRGSPDGPPVTDWTLVSHACAPSRDFGRHLDWLLHLLAGKEPKIASLREAGCFVHAAGFWQSAHGHGGPTFTARQLAGLAALGIEFRMEFWPREGPDT